MDLLSEFWTSFVLGLAAMVSPCVFPLYPGFLAYLAGQSQGERKVNPIWLGVFVFLGVMTMMMVLGMVIAALSVAVGSFLIFITPLAYVMIILLGILLLLDRNPFLKMSQIQVPVFANLGNAGPYANAFVYGLLYGPIAFPCSGPLLTFIVAKSLTVTSMFVQLSIFLFFGFGFGLPLLLLAFLSRAVQQRMVSLLLKHHRLVNVLAGALLIGVALYGLWEEWEIYSFYFSYYLGL